MSVANLLVQPEDGWVEIPVDGSLTFTLPLGGQHCIASSEPNALLIGHRATGKLRTVHLGAGERLYVRVSRPSFVVYTSVGFTRSNDYLNFNGLSYGRLVTPETLDRIVMTVVPKVDNTGLPTGAPAVTAGVEQVIDFVYSGSIQDFGRNGANYFDGVIANIEGYLLGVKVLDVPLDQKGANVQTNLADSNNNLNLFNVDQVEDWFELQEDGKFLGCERVVNGGFSLGDTGWELTPKWVVQNNRVEFTNLTSPSERLRQDSVFEIGKQYLVSFDVESTGTVGAEGAGGVVFLSGSSGTLSTIWEADAQALSCKRVQDGATGWLDNISGREILNP